MSAPTESPPPGSLSRPAPLSIHAGRYLRDHKALPSLYLLYGWTEAQGHRRELRLGPQALLLPWCFSEGRSLGVEICVGSIRIPRQPHYPDVFTKKVLSCFLLNLLWFQSSQTQVWGQSPPSTPKMLQDFPRVWGPQGLFPEDTLSVQF